MTALIRHSVLWIGFILPFGILMLTGCQKNPGNDFLSYQQQDADLCGTLTVGDSSYRVCVHTGENMTAVFQTPKILSEYTFFQKNGEILIQNGDLTSSAEGYLIVASLFDLFQLDPADFISSDREKVSGETVSVLQFTDDRILRLSSDGKPLLISNSVCEFRITL